jgi:chaperone BCS1
MTSFSNVSSLTMQSMLSEVSLLDSFLPGFTPVSTALRPLLAGELSIFARVLCVCAVFVFVGNYASEYLWKWLETHFS